MTNIPPILNSRMSQQTRGIDKDILNSIREKDDQKILEDKQKSIGKEYKSDESRLLQIIAAKSSKSDFREFLSIREKLKGTDKTLFTLAAMNTTDRLDDLNYVVKEDLPDFQTSGFLRAVYMSSEKEAGMLLDLARKFGSSKSESVELTLIVSAASNLNVPDMNNFIRAAHNGRADIKKIYKLAFGMEEKDRAKFLSAAAKAKDGLPSLLKWTENLGKEIIRKDVLEDEMIFIGLMSDGQPVSARFMDGKPGELSLTMPKRTKLQPEKTQNADGTDTLKFRNFLDKASKSGESVDGYLKLMDRSGFDQDNKIFKYIDSLEESAIPDFVNAASGAEEPDIERLMDMVDSFEGSNRKNFLAAAANSDQDLSKFMNITGRLEGDLLARFLSGAAKAGDNINMVLGMAQQLDNEELSKTLKIMDDMDTNEVTDFFKLSENSGIPVAELVKFLEKLEPENRKYFIAVAKEKGIGFKALFDKYKDMDAERINQLLDTEKTDDLLPFYATA